MTSRCAVSVNPNPNPKQREGRGVLRQDLAKFFLNYVVSHPAVTAELRGG